MALIIILVETTTLALAVLELLYLDQLMAEAVVAHRQQCLTPSRVMAVQAVEQLVALEQRLMEAQDLLTQAVVVEALAAN